MAQNRILVVDDERNFAEMLDYNLKKEGYTVENAYGGAEALEKFIGEKPDLVLLDLKMPGMDGLATLRKMKEIDGSVPVIMMSGHGDMDVAVEAMKLGAFDFVSKPFEPDELKITARNALQSRVLSMEVDSLRSQLHGKYDFKNIIGVSAGMQEIFKMMESVIGSSVTVLLLGESGTGRS